MPETDGFPMEIRPFFRWTACGLIDSRLLYEAPKKEKEDIG